MRSVHPANGRLSGNHSGVAGAFVSEVIAGFFDGFFGLWEMNFEKRFPSFAGWHGGKKVWNFGEAVARVINKAFKICGFNFAVRYINWRESGGAFDLVGFGGGW